MEGSANGRQSGLNPEGAIARGSIPHLSAIFMLVFLLACGGPVSPPPPTLPTPQPSPSASPVCLPIPQCKGRVWKVGIRECADVKFGESCLVDTTPFFEGGRCNSEDNSGCVSDCGAVRACEPDFERGPDFKVTVLSGTLSGYIRNPANPYQLRLQGVKGKIKVQSCWWGDDVDQEDGTPIDLSNASCGQVVFEPRSE